MKSTLSSCLEEQRWGAGDKVQWLRWPCMVFMQRTRPSQPQDHWHLRRKENSFSEVLHCRVMLLIYCSLYLLSVCSSSSWQTCFYTIKNVLRAKLPPFWTLYWGESIQGSSECAILKPATLPEPQTALGHVLREIMFQFLPVAFSK